jgi:hypothetical protein
MAWMPDLLLLNVTFSHDLVETQSNGRTRLEDL